MSFQNQQTKILYLNLTTWLGGGEYELYYLIKHLDRNRFYPIMVFNKEGSFVEKIKTLGVEILFVPFETVSHRKLISPKILWRNFKASLKIQRLIKNHKVQIVHCTEVLALLLLLPSLYTRNTKVLYCVISFYHGLRLFLFNILTLVFVKKIVVHSKLILEEFKKKTIGLSKKMEVIYLGVDDTCFSPKSESEKQKIRQKLGLPANKKIIGFIGRFEPYKKHNIFLHAAHHLNKRRNDLLFLIAGGALTATVDSKIEPYIKQVYQTIEDLKLEEKIIMLGHRDDIPEVIACLDVFVCPSDFEPFGLVVLEAAACNVPVVASRTVGALEVFDKLDGIFIAEPNDVLSFEKQIIQALQYQQKSLSSKHAILPSELTWQRCVSKFEKLYKTILE